MFGPIGMQELIIIFVIALIVFGPRKLPELGKSLGKSLAEFKRASNDLKHTLEEEVRLEETRREIMDTVKEAGPSQMLSSSAEAPSPASEAPSVQASETPPVPVSETAETAPNPAPAETPQS